MTAGQYTPGGGGGAIFLFILVVISFLKESFNFEMEKELSYCRRLCFLGLIP